ncbi:uncharacterized protein LOC133903259 [Phragmites australis]|uniref:uncharacterized protein LOC133903259 n=1 Tax=Phragmites australis TaxID=29695 RepID=UPI002D76E884|nr:uncharacterized protein LOC133903259 [Phragmites australis]
MRPVLALLHGPRPAPRREGAHPPRFGLNVRAAAKFPKVVGPAASAMEVEVSGVPNLQKCENGDDTPYPKWNIKNITGDADNVRLIVVLIHELLVETVEREASAAPRRFPRGRHGQRHDLPNGVLSSPVHAGPVRQRLLGVPPSSSRHGQLHHVPADGSTDPCHTVLFQVRGISVLQRPTHATSWVAIGTGGSSNSDHSGETQKAYEQALGNSHGCNSCCGSSISLLHLLQKRSDADQTNIKYRSLHYKWRAAGGTPSD